MEANSVPFIFFIDFIHSLHHLLSKFSPLYQNPLFSTIVTLYTLILLYVPSLFFTTLSSPVLNSTGIILLSLLRLGAINEKLQQESISQGLVILDSGYDERLGSESRYLESRVLDHKDRLTSCSSLALDSSFTKSRFLDFVDQTETHIEGSNLTTGLGLACNQARIEYEPKYGLDTEYNQTHVKCKHDMGLESNSMESSQEFIEEERAKEEMDPKHVDTTTKSFLEWNMRTPLEIIYEAYEGEEDEEEEENNETNEDSGNKQGVGCERCPSLSMYYSDSETNSSSDDDFPMNEKWETYESVFFKWEEEEEEEGEELIEISFDHYGKRGIPMCHSEEENLIEIDIFLARNK